MELLGGHDVACQRFDQRIEEPETPGHPFGHGGALELNPFTGVDLRLPIQRQVIAVLRDQDVGEQSRAGESALVSAIFMADIIFSPAT